MAIIDKIQLSGTVYTIGNETTTAVTSASTDNEIPTAKAVYDAIPQGGSITVDQTIDRTSENPISNKAISNKATDGNGNVFNTGGRYKWGFYSVGGVETNKGFWLDKINGEPVIRKYNVTRDLSFVETSAITTSVTSASTDVQVPSAKAVYDALQEGGGSSYTAGTGIDITNDVISVSGVSHNSLADGTKMLLKGNVTSVGQNYSSIGFDYYYGTSSNKNSINIKPLTINGNSALRTQALSISVVETSAITTSVTSSSTDAQVPSAKAVNDKLGGLSLVKLTQAEYDALATKDSNVLYVIVG